MIGKIGVLAGLVALLALVAATPASAAPVLDVKARWANQNLQPGQNGLLLLRVRNLGDSATSGDVTVTDQLPPGVTRIPPTFFDEIFGRIEGRDWTCTGTTEVSCTYSKPIAPLNEIGPPNPSWGSDYHEPGSGPYWDPSKASFGIAAPLFVRVAVDPGASGTHRNTVEVSGGSADSATDDDAISFAPGDAKFGIVEDSVRGNAYDARYPAGEPVTQAGAHPYELRVDFDFNLLGGEVPAPPGLEDLISPFGWAVTAGQPRTIAADQPAGLIGNPEATPKCRPVDFIKPGAGQYTSAECPPETQVGVLALETGGYHGNKENHGYGEDFNPASWLRVPIYNLEPPKGKPADFGFNAGEFRGHIYAELDPTDNYRIRTLTPYISSLLVVRQAELTLWGVPADPAHDDMRARPRALGGELLNAYGIGSGAPIRPFLTLPSRCGDRGGFVLRADSWQHPGEWTLPVASESMVVDGCDDGRIPFDPTLDLQPTSREAGAPTGLSVDLEVPQRDDLVNDANELYEQNGDVQALNAPPIKGVSVTLPEGMTVSPSSAQGLGGCSPDQIGLGTDDPVACPQSAQVATMTLHSPILPADRPMKGRVYVATQNANPFNSLVALYLVLEDSERGLLVKIPGRVDLDPETGRVKTVFDDLPELPTSRIEVDFKSGPRAPLVNPRDCGTATATAELTSWTRPNEPVKVQSSFALDRGPGGGACSTAGFAPRLQAGTVSPIAGAFSPMALTVAGRDGDQDAERFEAKLPKGLLGKVAGVPVCPAGTADAGACADGSRIGRVEVAAGAGSAPLWLPQQDKAATGVFLAGPYRGAPYSLSVVVPAQAGPFDLGRIVVRTPLDVDVRTAELSTRVGESRVYGPGGDLKRVLEGKLPTIVEGIPVKLREARVIVDRPGFTVNPTDCSAKQTTATLISVAGARADMTSPFQVTNCAALPFKPKIGLRLTGRKQRTTGKHPGVRAVVTQKAGEAGIKHAKVVLPPSLALDPDNAQALCEYEDGIKAEPTCPKGSVVGRAKAVSPLLDRPLTGKVYFVKNVRIDRRTGNRIRTLPMIVVALRGEIAINLRGESDTAKSGQLVNTFAAVPDAPIRRFDLAIAGGRNGILAVTRTRRGKIDICRGKQVADADVDGHNGRRSAFRIGVKTPCAKARKAKGKAKRD